MTRIPPSEDTTRNMVTGSGNGQLLTSNSTGVDSTTPTRTRAREDKDEDSIRFIDICSAREI